MNSDLKDTKAIVRQWWKALERGDIPTVVNSLADDMVWEVMGMDELMPITVFRSKEVVARDLLPIFSQMYDVKNLEFDITNMIAEGSTVAMEFTINAILLNGRAYKNVKYVAVVKVDNGKIKSMREYADGLKVKAALA